METKVCSKCQLEKELDLFKKNKRGKNGIGGTCKKCHTQKCMEFYYNNLEKKRADIKRYALENPEKKQARGKRYRELNKERLKQYSKDAWEKKKEIYLGRKRELSKELSDTYVLQRLHNSTMIPSKILKEIPGAIETKRMLLKIQRTIKQQQDAKN